jgi:hypothetical protein
MPVDASKQLPLLQIQANCCTATAVQAAHKRTADPFLSTMTLLGANHLWEVAVSEALDE